MSSFVLSDKENSLSFAFCESETEKHESVLVEMKLACQGISGSTNSWYEYDAIRKFLDEMQLLNENRIGSAVLRDMSYGSESEGVRLEIFSIDKLGHMAVNVEFRKPVLLANSKSIFSAGVSGCFEIEPALPTYIAAFRKLFQFDA